MYKKFDPAPTSDLAGLPFAALWRGRSGQDPSWPSRLIAIAALTAAFVAVIWIIGAN